MAEARSFNHTTTSNSGRISRKAYTIAGILTTAYGLDELPPKVPAVACLWLLHPRLVTQESMSRVAETVIGEWHGSNRQAPSGETVGLIAVSFDQRNHGTRSIDHLANQAWADGNPSHAQDMFSIIQGTARDVSLLIDFLPSFFFPDSRCTITQHIVLGISLGGHAAWSCLLHEPRVNGGVVILGCPDYLNLITHRARSSQLPSWTQSHPPGSQFLGSKDFPSSLVNLVRQLDPSGIFLRLRDAAVPNRNLLSDGHTSDMSENEIQALRQVFGRLLGGKKILNLSGGVDPLVPYHLGESFLVWLKRCISPHGCFADSALIFEDVIDQTAKHELTDKMLNEAVRFIIEVVAADDTLGMAGVARKAAT